MRVGFIRPGNVARPTASHLKQFASDLAPTLPEAAAAGRRSSRTGERS